VIDSVVVWKWEKPGYRSMFTAHHVNTMRNMVARHYSAPHRFICITDDPVGIDSGIDVVPLWNDWADIPNPTWPMGPSCYRRLRAFSPEFEAIAGRRFVSLDLDTVITGSLEPLFDRSEDFVVWDPLTKGYRYNGSMWLMTAGCRSKVWSEFDPRASPQQTHRAGHKGSDQAWMEFILKPDEATWTAKDGVLGFKRDCARQPRGRLPSGARVVMFHGKPDPWEAAATRVAPWILDHYC